jgi:heme-degrading monooxygenase HmoA
MIARAWHGATPESKSEEYAAYLRETGLEEIRHTEGNQGVFILRRVADGRADFLFVSLWDSWAAIDRFAGEDRERAVYYPRDREYLLELEPKVTHYEVLVSPTEIART